MFAAAAELPTFQDGHLVRELVDFDLAVFELAVLAGDGLVKFDDPLALARQHLFAAGGLIDQPPGQRAQLLGAQAVQLFGIDHGRQFAKPCGARPLADAPIAPHWPLAASFTPRPLKQA